MAGVVCVTGATGFLGSHVVEQLLEKGYTVHGTVRSLKSETLHAHLKRLSDALPGRLKLFEAELLHKNSFDNAVAGCTYVFHTASPFVIEVPDPQKDLIEPAVKGTQNVLSSVIAHKNAVKRVILTSSVAAVHGEYGAPPVSGDLYTDHDWNETSTIENGQAYHLSKRLAEQEAWALAKASGIDLITICPNFILGPALSNRIDGLSAGFVKGMLEGTAPSGAPIVCDVRDVARAHVLAAETPSAKGRYIVSHRSAMQATQMAAVLRQRFQNISLQDAIPTSDDGDRIDDSRLSELGLRLRPAEETLADMAAVLIAFGAAKPQLKQAQ